MKDDIGFLFPLSFETDARGCPFLTFFGFGGFQLGRFSVGADQLLFSIGWAMITSGKDPDDPKNIGWKHLKIWGNFPWLKSLERWKKHVSGLGEKNPLTLFYVRVFSSCGMLFSAISLFVEDMNPLGTISLLVLIPSMIRTEIFYLNRCLPTLFSQFFSICISIVICIGILLATFVALSEICTSVGAGPAVGYAERFSSASPLVWVVTIFTGFSLFRASLRLPI